MKQTFSSPVGSLTSLFCMKIFSELWIIQRRRSCWRRYISRYPILKEFLARKRNQHLTSSAMRVNGTREEASSSRSFRLTVEGCLSWGWGPRMSWSLDSGLRRSRRRNENATRVDMIHFASRRRRSRGSGALEGWHKGSIGRRQEVVLWFHLTTFARLRLRRPPSHKLWLRGRKGPCTISKHKTWTSGTT